MQGLSQDRLEGTLKTCWEETKDADITHVFLAGWQSLIASLLRSKTKTYRYPVITQLLAKVSEPEVDCTCIQSSRSAQSEGNFDARSVCHDVVVPWELRENSPLGGSKEPYINNPLRVPEFSLHHRKKQRDKEGWDQLCTLFSHIQSNPTEARPALMQALLEVRKIQEEQHIQYPVPLRISVGSCLAITSRFLSHKSGGERLQLVCYALMSALAQVSGMFDEVATSKVNASDASEGKPADVVCRKDGVTVLALEVKDTELTMTSLESAMRNARVDQVGDLILFVRGLQGITPEMEARMKTEFGLGAHVHALDSERFSEQVLALVGGAGRIAFLKHVAEGMKVMGSSFQTRKHWAELLETVS